MGRPDQSDQKRVELMPIVARAFAQLGYRRATTAELSRRCGVQENILYRLWPDKKAMFIASLEHVYLKLDEIWTGLVREAQQGQTAAQRVLAYESEHLGEFGFYRLVFAGLNETDDPDIREAMRVMYENFQRFISRQIASHRGARVSPSRVDVQQAAWAVIGLGTVANICLELGLLTDDRRRRLIGEIGDLLLEGKASDG